MYKTTVKSFSSAHSGRAYKIVLAPPFLIYGLFGLSILLQIPAGYVIHHLSFTLGMLINQLLMLLVPVLVVIRVFNLTGVEVLPFRKISILQAVIAVVMMCFLAVVTDYMIFATEWALPVTEKLADIYKELMKIDGFWSYMNKFALLCILPGFCEEVFFRGFCQTGLERFYGRTVGILITAALFAIAHLSPWYTPIYFLLGIFLSWIFSVSRSLWIPVICHIVNNWWTFNIHTLGWGIPLKGSHIWWNIPILAVSLGILWLAIYVWTRFLRIETY